MAISYTSHHMYQQCVKLTVNMRFYNRNNSPATCRRGQKISHRTENINGEIKGLRSLWNRSQCSAHRFSDHEILGERTFLIVKCVFCGKVFEIGVLQERSFGIK